MKKLSTTDAMKQAFRDMGVSIQSFYNKQKLIKEAKKIKITLLTDKLT